MDIKDIKSHLKKFTVGVAGAGGLGSNCAVSLARCGVGNLVICDFDKVDAPNLNRQYYFVSQQGMQKVEALKENIINTGSFANIKIHSLRLNPENIPVIFEKCSIIVEALDDASEKEMLINTVQTKMPDTILIVASGVAGWSDINKITCRKVDETFYICGDGSSEVSDELPALAPKVGMVANMQADIVIEILMNL